MTDWRKSTFSDTGNCVEVRTEDQMVWVRNSRQPRWLLHFTPAEWDAFLAGVKADEFG